jgi:single-stranded-DNA-specific exonuclease
MRWLEPTPAEADVASLRRELGDVAGSRVLATLLCGRGLVDAATVNGFLNPRLAELGDPALLPGVADAVARLRRAMRAGERILVYGDYDVDGVTSTAFLISVLQRFGIHPQYFVPRRMDEGYGLSVDGIERALAAGQPDLLIAVDCGTSSRAAVATLRARGIDVIIIDHHTSKEALPEDCIIVNPHLWDAFRGGDWGLFCTVGLVFKVMHALLRQLRTEGDDLAEEVRLREYLDLIALGTLCDLVPLRGENRILVTHGLKLLTRAQRSGLAALMEVSGMKLGDEISPFDIAFKLGPRINASGRLADATMPIEMLLGDDLQQARNQARQLDAFNRERQDIERQITEAAIAMVEAQYANDPGIVLYHPDWHSGVVGIVASRVANRFFRPTLVLGADGDSLAKGSGRSIEGVNLVAILQSCQDVMEKWGGHPMAIGLSIDVANIELLRHRFCAALAAQHGAVRPERTLAIDCWVQPHELTEGLLTELDRLAPFGQGNPEPVLAVRGVAPTSVTPFGNGHMRFQLDTRGCGMLTGIAWGGALNPMPVGQSINLAFRFGWNVWQGRKSPRLTLLDWQVA